MIVGLRLGNIRSLLDTGKIEFRPITLLLGQNSSGKSTFLRALPLLKQSIRTRSNAPILWFGDFVDFGSIKEVRSTLTEKDSVELEFYANNISVNKTPYYYRSDDANSLNDVRLRLELVEEEESTRLRAFQLSVQDDTIFVALDPKGSAKEVNVNTVDLSRLLPPDRYKFLTTELVPQILGTSRQPRRQDPYFFIPARSASVGYREIVDFLGARLNNRVSLGSIRDLAQRVVYAPGRDFESSLRAVNSNLKSWKHFVEEVTSPYNTHLFENLRAMFFLSHMPAILSSFSSSLSTDFNNLAYVGPSRATGERYYRHQELAVDQIDPQGRNLAMFLYSLPPAQKDQFSRWLEEAIGYSIKLIRSSGHMQIELREVGSLTYHNLADMGYGFSQVLPVMAQIWSREIGNRHTVSSPFVTIEQPELHLHPAYQARLADVFTKAVTAATRGPSRGLTFVIETHSEALINRLGELVYSGAVPAEAIAIYLFEKEETGGATRIQRAAFDKHGGLSNWPIGFFSASA